MKGKKFKVQKKQDKKRIILTILLVGMICIMMVVLTAFAAQIRHENNELETKNEALQGEVDTLSVKIKSANSIDHIEKVATKKLGMVHPSEDECVNLSDKDKPKKNFAAVIRKEAYN